jgi:inosose dehydratase
MPSASASISVGAQLVTWGAERVRADLDGVLHEAAEAGAEGVEVGLHLIEQHDEEAVRAALRRHSLAFIGGVVRLDLHHAEQRAANRVLLERGLERVAALGGQHVTVATLRTMPTPPSTVQTTMAVTALNELGAVAAGRGLRLHDHNYSVAAACGELARVCLETDPHLVWLTLDLAWLHKGGGDGLAFLNAWLHRVRHIHVKDVQAGQVCPVGAGDLGYPVILRQVLAGGYRGWLAVELERLPTGPDAWAALDEDLTYQTVAEPALMVRQSITWLRQNSPDTSNLGGLPVRAGPESR